MMVRLVQPMVVLYFTGKGYYSKYAPYGVQATSGNLIIEGSRYPRQSLLEVSGENNVATAGIIPTCS